MAGGEGVDLRIDCKRRQVRYLGRQNKTGFLKDFGTTRDDKLLSPVKRLAICLLGRRRRGGEGFHTPLLSALRSLKVP